MIIVAISEFHGECVSARFRVKSSADYQTVIRRMPANHCIGHRPSTPTAERGCECGFPVRRTRWENETGEEINVSAEITQSGMLEITL
jgi:hypothetical protein